MLRLLSKLSSSDIPIIKSTIAEDRLKKMVKTPSNTRYIESLLGKPTYRTNPFKVSDYYSF